MLSRRATDAMRQEAHDYRLALGSFAAGACAPAARDARAVSPVRNRAVPISKGRAREYANYRCGYVL